MPKAINTTTLQKDGLPRMSNTPTGTDGSGTILTDPVGTVPGRRRQCLNTKGRCNYCVNSKSPPADAVI